MIADKSADPAIPDAMQGEGYYDGHSKVQGDAVAGQVPRLRRAAAALDVTAGELRIVDYGCGPGRNSMVAFRAILDEIFKRRADMPVVCCHNDQAGNDWNGLFANVAGQDGYLGSRENIRVEALVGSFFRQVASSGSVDLGMSSMAAHWFDRAPELASPGTMYFWHTEGETRQRLAEIADADWSAFLTNRARELKPGGWLVVDMAATVVDEAAPGGFATSGQPHFPILWAIAEEMVAEGLYDGALLGYFLVPVYWRTLDELRAPLERDAQLGEAFETVELTTETIPDPFIDDFERTGDAETYGTRWAAFLRAVIASVFHKGLSVPSSSNEAEAERLTEIFFDRLRDKLSNLAGQVTTDFYSAIVVLRRR
jgi:SAM-dependent methyltransferase